MWLEKLQTYSTQQWYCKIVAFILCFIIQDIIVLKKQEIKITPAMLCCLYTLSLRIHHDTIIPERLINAVPKQYEYEKTVGESFASYSSIPVWSRNTLPSLSCPYKVWHHALLTHKKKRRNRTNAMQRWRNGSTKPTIISAAASPIRHENIAVISHWRV